MSEKAKELFKNWLKSEKNMTVADYESLAYRERDYIMSDFLDFAANEI